MTGQAFIGSISSMLNDEEHPVADKRLWEIQEQYKKNLLSEASELWNREVRRGGADHQANAAGVLMLLLNELGKFGLDASTFSRIPPHFSGQPQNANDAVRSKCRSVIIEAAVKKVLSYGNPRLSTHVALSEEISSVLLRGDAALRGYEYDIYDALAMPEEREELAGMKQEQPYRLARTVKQYMIAEIAHRLAQSGYIRDRFSGEGVCYSLESVGSICAFLNAQPWHADKQSRQIDWERIHDTYKHHMIRHAQTLWNHIQDTGGTVRDVKDLVIYLHELGKFGLDSTLLFDGDCDMSLAAQEVRNVCKNIIVSAVVRELELTDGLQTPEMTLSKLLAMPDKSSHEYDIYNALASEEEKRQDRHHAEGERVMGAFGGEERLQPYRMAYKIKQDIVAEAKKRTVIVSPGGLDEADARQPHKGGLSDFSDL